MKTFGDFDGLALFVHVAQSGACGSRARNRHIESYLIPPPVSSGGHAKCPSSEKNEKGIVLTDHGQQLFDRSRDAFAIAEEAIATVQNEKVVFSGTVRLSLPPDIATEVLAPALIRFKLRYPEVVVDMTLADRRVSLIEGLRPRRAHGGSF